ncbi:MAG TPA: response regulator transcription factor [Nitrospira sp.]|nr:response regulator transcription factor [Nitrospira sp.]
MKSESRVRVLLTDDHDGVRHAVYSLLNSYSDLEVVGEATNGLEAIHFAAGLQPDVIVMNINMPILDGVKATHMIKARHPHMIVLGLSVETRKERVAEMLSAGASTVLRKEAACDQLHAAICSYTRNFLRSETGLL